MDAVGVPLRTTESLNWSQRELEQGKVIKIKAFPKEKKVKLFRGKSLYRNTARISLFWER